MNRTLKNIFKGDGVIWIIFLFLCLVSAVEVYSASSMLTYGSSYIMPVVKHVMLLLVGLCCMILTMNIPCRYFKVALPFLLAISVLSLLGVYFVGAINDGHRWIRILGIQFQPSEIAKGTLVLAVAQILSVMQTDKGADKNAFGYVMLVSVPIIVLIFPENFSTAALLSIVVFMMMVIGRVPAAQLGKLMGVVAIGVIAFISCVMVLGQDDGKLPDDKQQTEVVQTAPKKKGGLLHRMDLWKGRIDQFLSPQDVSPDKVDLRGVNSQRAHANIAIVSSGVTGKGPGNSEQVDYLPQAYSDFIYAVIIEEFGLGGAFLVALFYIILLFRTGIIANRCENNFPAYLAMGLALMLVTQALFNMCVAVGLAPITGQPLPLISKGGTSSIINCVYLGVILSISRTAAKRRDPDPGKDSKELATVKA